MNNKIILESLAMDLKRVALGFHRRSNTMAERFMQEAMARKKEIKKESIDKYVLRLLSKMEESFKTSDNSKKAEDALMYSTLFQNASLKI